MNKAIDLLTRYAADESGATAIEYGLIAALIGMGTILGMNALASNQDSAWNNLATKISTTVD